MPHPTILRHTTAPLRLVRVSTRLRSLPEAETIPGRVRPFVIVAPLFRGTRVSKNERPAQMSHALPR